MMAILLRNMLFSEALSSGWQAAKPWAVSTGQRGAVYGFTLRLFIRAR
jgi:hypothetical protein